ncbi:hypothetical protein [Actibacterium sp. 188UL27-1]|uniref:hypothetical protein n=1 Tax=Actibacterium sp. 188UL27-1 TaxID=2786961 RepID=UPI00195E8BA4|nr:hypothetical protein [Actibacterium sp. 188UL27-1]MBM7069540.1 hypothetical protein [Actibacterium sp. 188UL27-1]
MKYAFSERGVKEFSCTSASTDMSIQCDTEKAGRLLLLQKEKTEADNIIQLISAANLILEGFPLVKNPPNSGFELPSDEVDRESIFENVFRRNGFFQQFTHRETLPVAVAIAAIAWPDKKLVYAIHKLARSYETESVTPWSMHPCYKEMFQKHTENFSSHVDTSVAINLAYSAVEELGLTVQASAKRPRSVGQGTFKWNPVVLLPFQERLQNAGTASERTIDWITRGRQTEVNIYKTLDNPSDYSDGVDVRDRRINIPDAINFCEYLRNFMTAHAFSTDTTRLGPYEVYNVQQIARLLILSKCDLWNTGTDDLRNSFG